MRPASKIFETNKLSSQQIPPTIKSTLMTLEMKLDEIRNEGKFLDSYACWYKVAAVDSDDCVSGEFLPAGKKKKQLKFIQGNSDKKKTERKKRCSFHKGKISTKIFHRLSLYFQENENENQ